MKALEQNLTLSNGYLEELSRSYKEQVESLQASLAAGQSSLSEVLKLNRDLEQRVHVLQHKVAELENPFSRGAFLQWSAVGVHAVLLLVSCVIARRRESRRRRDSHRVVRVENVRSVQVNGKIKRKKKKSKQHSEIVKVSNGGLKRSMSSQEFKTTSTGEFGEPKRIEDLK